MLYVFTANRTKRSLAEKKRKILIFQYFFRQTRRVQRSCMYILRAAQNEVWREKDEKSPVKHCAETLIRE